MVASAGSAMEKVLLSETPFSVRIERGKCTGVSRVVLRSEAKVRRECVESASVHTSDSPHPAGAGTGRLLWRAAYMQRHSELCIQKSIP